MCGFCIWMSVFVQIRCLICIFCISNFHTTGRVDKLDNSFSRSRSSSMSSLENVSAESVTCLAFADSYTKKSGKWLLTNVVTPLILFFHFCLDPSTLLPTLWVGTSLGSVLTVSISLPDSDIRKTQPVVVSILGMYYGIDPVFL